MGKNRIFLSKMQTGFYKEGVEDPFDFGEGTGLEGWLKSLCEKSKYEDNQWSKAIPIDVIHKKIIFKRRDDISNNYTFNYIEMVVFPLENAAAPLIFEKLYELRFKEVDLSD